MLREGTYLQERYEIIERIGSGGMSDVYKARDRKLNRLVGIKVLKAEFCSDREFVRKFKLEAQAAAGLSHPNVVNVYDVVDEDDLHYIVMELVEGITLKDFIASKGRLGMLETIGISIQIALGISAAHARHIIHRDIKPQNVIISSDGKAKVADFGIARAATSDTLTSTAMGSVHYISPEQARGENSDARSDIYSLGITMYEMVTGKLPFEGDTSVAIALSHIEGDMPLASRSNPDVTPAFDQIILKCCQKRPDRRYQSIDDVIIDLRSLLNNPEKDVEIKKAPIPSSIAGDTVVLTQQEVAEINVRAKIKNDESKKKERDNYLKDKDEEEHSGKLEKVIAIGGIILAIIVVLAVIFFIMRFSGVIGNSATDISNSIGVITGDKPLVSDKQTVVPDVVGLNVQLGENKLKDYNLGIEVKAYEFDDSVEKDGIISQYPEADEVVDKYTAVSVVVSKGATGGESNEESVPAFDLSSMLLRTENDVRNYLLDNGFQNIETISEFSNECAPGVVMAINPINPEPGNVITLTVSKGEESDLTQMPSIVGLTEEDSIGALADAHLQPGTVTQMPDDVVPAGSIVSQAVPSGTNIAKGTQIAYTVSLGPDADSKYIASIRTSYNLADLVGPGSSGMQIPITVRLHQVVQDPETGEWIDQYTTLMEPRTVSGTTILPIKFDYIEGAYGVDVGQVEIVDLDKDEVIKSYDIEFFKQQ